MRRADRLTGLLLLAFAGYTILSGWRMGYWQGRIPGPGFAPIWIGAGLALSALFLLLRRPPVIAADDVPWMETVAGHPGEGVRPAVLLLEMAVMTIAAILLVPRLGMMGGVALLLLALVKVLGGTWRAALGTAVVLPAAFYLLFVRWLQVPVPKGPWGF